jgi:hypothetical protein
MLCSFINVFTLNIKVVLFAYVYWLLDFKFIHCLIFSSIFYFYKIVLIHVEQKQNSINKGKYIHVC